MILCLDVGNGQIFGGLYDHHANLKLRFRRRSVKNASSDELGLFLRSVLRENNYQVEEIKKIGICSVVPDVIYSLNNACQNYFQVEPFLLRPGVKSGLQIKYRNPIELGADRIANSIAAIVLHPNKNILIVDLGTATTFCAISSKKEYLGGAILPGVKIAMESLVKNTAKLPTVEIIRPVNACGRSTVECIQSGLYYSNVGMLKELSSQLTEECFKGERPIIIGTGGFSGLFADSQLFDEINPNLVLFGIYQSLLMNS